MKAFLVHCGYYDSEVCAGVYESHVNYFVAAESREFVKERMKSIEEFVSKKMHIDGVHELNVIDGHRVELIIE